MEPDRQSGGDEPSPGPTMNGLVTIGDSKVCQLLGIRKRQIPFRYLIDIRLCTIAGILCSLTLLDSNILASAAVTSMISDLKLDQGNRFSICIFVSTISSIVFQLPCTILVRTYGPRRFFGLTTMTFGLITFFTIWVQNWQQLLVARVLLGAASSGIYPGLTYLISTWYKREEQQMRYAYMHCLEVIILATGTLANYAINKNLDGNYIFSTWQLMFIVQGSCTFVLGVVTHEWMIDFPDKKLNAVQDPADIELYNFACRRIVEDRDDLIPTKLSWGEIFSHAKDMKIWAFAVLFFLQSMVTVALAYFVPIILRDGLGYSANTAIILSSPPYYFSVVPLLLSSFAADRWKMRAPCIAFNSICMIIGFAVLGFATSPEVRYLGVFLATGAYVANWAALSAYQANNIYGQWKRVFTAALCTMFNGAGGIAGAFIVRPAEAPRYTTAIWVSIGSQILILVIIALLSALFFLVNKRLRELWAESEPVRPGGDWLFTL